jgi:parallel beta-helix repeat protein
LTPIGTINTGALADKTIVALAGGFLHTLALDSGGKVYGWGYNVDGQLGCGTSSNLWFPVPVDTSGVLAGKTITAIAAGEKHSIALSSEGKVYSWGSNAFGQLGTTTVTSTLRPIEVDMSGALAGKTITQIAAGNFHSVALASDGTVYTWGKGANGEIGNGSTNNQFTPVAVSTSGMLAGKIVTAIAAGTSFCLTLASDGGLYSWGNNGAGQLGNGSYMNSSVPVAVNMSGVLAGKSVTAITCGGTFGAALSSDGLFYGWGENYYGQLGTGSPGYTTLPVAANTSGALAGQTLTAIRGGGAHSLALASDGRVYSWGWNERGQLGNNSNSNGILPGLLYPNLKNVTLLTGGFGHSLALGDLINLPPTANNQSVGVRPSQSVQITLTASDPEKDPLTYSVVNQPTKGTLSGTAPNLIYTANADFAGDDWFRFKASDGTSDSNLGTVSIILAEAPSLIVTTTSDVVSATDHKTSLREAINYANSQPGANTITFNIPTTDQGYSNGVFSIYPTGALPTLSDTGTWIDGTSQTTATGNTNASGPEVVINGRSSGSVHGLAVSAGACKIKGLVINGFTAQSCAGVYIFGQNASNVRIEGCYIGTNPTGTLAVANNYGVFVNNAYGAYVGGTTPDTRNVISGNNNNGVEISGANSSSTYVINNYIGTNAAGTSALGNFKGVSIANGAGSCQIGFNIAGWGNVISGNRYMGVGIQGSGQYNALQNNIIGLNAAGTAPLGNASSGITLHNGARNVLIGGNGELSRNVISANGESGIYINYHTSGNNTIQGNYIGTNINGTNGVTAGTGNRSDGIYMDAGSSGNTIGGSAQYGNRIAFNTRDGIGILTDSLGNSINNNLRGNQIYSNGGLGINLRSSGEAASTVTANDAGDGDSNGGNQFQNYPVLSSAINSARGLTIKGTLNSIATTSFTLDFFSSPTADASGYGEGQSYLGSKSVVTEGDGNLSFELTVAGVAPGQVITALATDKLGNTSEFSRAITVVANRSPIADDQSVEVAEDGNAPIVLTASDVEGDALTYSVVQGPAHGTLSGTAPNLTYTPDANYNGPDSFTFKANDGTANSNTATVSLNITPVSDAPTAQSQNLSVAEDTALDITLNGSDVDGDALTYTVVAQPQHGTLSGEAPNLTYTPDANYNGDDFFTFQANDGAIDSNAATINITVTPQNDAPVAQNQSITTDEDNAKSITLAAIDVDSDELSFEVVDGPAHGSLSGTGANRTYTPAVNYNGPDSFTFKTNDGTTDSNIAMVSITVTPVNDAPLAASQSVDATEDTAKDITISATDEEGGVLSYTVVRQPQHGTLSGTAPNLTYTPAANYNGNDSFTFKANDGTDDSEVTTISISVSPVNDAPTLTTVTALNGGVEDTALTISYATLAGAADALDVEGDALSFRIEIVQSGTLTKNGVNVIPGTLLSSGESLSWKPAANTNGTLSAFDIKAWDGDLASANKVAVNVNVAAVNDAPGFALSGTSLVVKKNASAQTRTGWAINISTGPSDESSQGRSFIVTNSNNTLFSAQPVISSNGTLTFTPAKNKTGTATVDVKLQDSGGTANGGANTSTTLTFSIRIG